MKRLALIAIGLATLSSTNAEAQIGKLLGVPRNGEASGSYQANDQIRTFVSARPYDDIDLYGLAIAKAAEMTRARGFSRFGVTKYDCSTMLMNGIPTSSGCYIIAIMLHADGLAKPRGKRTVQYYEVDDVLAGIIARPRR